MGTYRFAQQAIQDLDEICDFIASTRPKAASRLFDIIRQKCKRVAEFPHMGKDYSSIRPNLRGFIVDGYIIFYYPVDVGISIVRVINGRRDLKTLFRELSDDPTP